MPFSTWTSTQSAGQEYRGIGEKFRRGHVPAARRIDIVARQLTIGESGRRRVRRLGGGVSLRRELLWMSGTRLQIRFHAKHWPPLPTCKPTDVSSLLPHRYPACSDTRGQSRKALGPSASLGLSRCASSIFMGVSRVSGEVKLGGSSNPGFCSAPSPAQPGPEDFDE